MKTVGSFQARNQFMVGLATAMHQHDGAIYRYNRSTQEIYRDWYVLPLGRFTNSKGWILV